MDNVGQISCAALLKRLRKILNGEEDLPDHDMEFSIPALLEGGTPQEIEELINLCEVIAIFEEQEHLQSTDKLVTCLLNSSIVEDSTEALDKVIRLSAELCKDEFVAKESDRLTYRANNYAVALARRYWQQGKPEDLDKAIALSEKAVAASSQATFIMSKPRGTILQQPGLEVQALNTLAARLDEHFQLTGALESLNRSISIMESLLASVSGPNWKASRAEWLGNLAASLQRRYEQNDGDSTDDIDRAIDISRDLLQATDQSDPQRPLVLCTLANALGGRAGATNQIHDLEAATDLLREARNITPTYHAKSIEVGYNLALRLFQRGALADVNESISVAESTLERTDINHPIQPHLQNLLGALHYEQYLQRPSKQGALRALELSWDAIQSSHYPSVLYRVQAGRRILHLCCEMDNWLAAFKAALATVELIPRLSSREIRNSDKQRLLSKEDVVGFSSDAVAAALNAEKSEFEAVRLLEMGRGSLASSVAELRTDITALRREHSELAQRFIQLRDELQIKSSRQHSASIEFDTLLSEIRQQPGFERFLLPLTNQAILDAARNGPIVMLNESKYRRGIDAILIEQERIRLVKLGVTLEDVKVPLSCLQDQAFLERLWDLIARPILEELGIGLPSSGVPLPRIWWIPTGSLSRLPFHAAGRHFTSSTDGVIDRVVSSYSSSIRTLLDTRSCPAWRPKLKKDNVLLVGMSDTPGCSTLPYALEEIRTIASLFATKGFGNTLLDNSRAQKQNVLHLLKTCSIFHFAGHAMEDALNPLRSTLLLYDREKDPMTVENLLHLNLNENSPFLAFLAACETGRVTLSRFQDESIHLVAAYQLAGFRHVIGTLWSVEDQMSLNVAKGMYTNLLHGMTDERVSRSLHEATRRLRDTARDLKEVTNQPDSRDIISVDSTDCGLIREGGSWIPFVHFGI
ncbi:CHAT domain-containing protein [Fusarium tricinctum]|uniref:CHAT domain-containing protein n=1 Tax=Fusarium tricinctum TaxID=61284 RepID=A0A8K0RVR6_9HYPO|nr:CHAT domain-containing protein [Fusarium tricinctum]